MTPDGSPDRVRDMFARIAPSYDLLNHLLSFQIDRYWRLMTTRRVAHILGRPDARVLDICCGSGDLLLALAGHARATVLGGDFCHPMLVEARRKIARRRSRAALFEGDALGLPVGDGSLDLVTVAFGLRNLTDYAAGLAEMRRVLKPGGVAAILEFSMPPGRLLGPLYRFYSRRLLPAIGGAISGSPEAYAYLPESVARFPDAEELGGLMRRAGFTGVRWEPMTGGVVALHLGEAAA